MSKLSILLVSCYEEFNKSGTTLTIADKWKQINSSRWKNPILNTMILEFCSDSYCENGEIYCDNERSKCLQESRKFYEKLHEEMENAFLSNWQSYNRKKKEMPIFCKSIHNLLIFSKKKKKSLTK